MPSNERFEKFADINRELRAALAKDYEVLAQQRASFDAFVAISKSKSVSELRADLVSSVQIQQSNSSYQTDLLRTFSREQGYRIKKVPKNNFKPSGIVLGLAMILLKLDPTTAAVFLKNTLGEGNESDPKGIVLADANEVVIKLPEAEFEQLLSVIRNPRAGRSNHPNIADHQSGGKAC